ncbi:MAG: GGDEF domain-containing protein [Spirochaetales bacterium]|nr:GGDEF domain-containing protein [Spirochaetales bacterium]
MNDRIVIFIKNNLEQFAELISMIKEDAPFVIVYISFDDLISDKYRTILKETSPAQLYFGVDPSFYTAMKEKLTRYIRSIFQLPFSHFIYIHQDPEFMHEPHFILGKSRAFYFSQQYEYQHQARYFIIHQLQLFENAITSTRLSEYIADSFKEVVYSEILEKKNKEIQRLYNQLEQKNKLDYLTNLYNRGALFNFLEKERKRTLRALWRLNDVDSTTMANRIPDIMLVYENKPQGILINHFGIYSILMIDIDNFKSVNDKYGHLVGDQVLKALGDLILHKNLLREIDIAGRFGGEEFIIILPETNAHNACKPALRLAEKFKRLTFPDNKEEPFSISLSIGISEYHPNDKTNDDIIHRADKALYYAKKHCKGTVVIYENVFSLPN